jgi:thioredoxin reductase (NADPH)
MTMKHQVIIIGSGPAGLTAAIYTSRANLSPVLFEGLQPGGQLMITTDVENFPGFPEGVQGPELMDLMRKQAGRFGTQLVSEEITKVVFGKGNHQVWAGDQMHEAPAAIISTGATARYLGIPGEEDLKGRGVSACATCDGFFFRQKDVFVVGGGDSAMEEATYLAGICRSVIVVHRRLEFRASPYMVDRARERENIRFELDQIPVRLEASEDGTFRAAVLRNVSTGEERTVEADGFFVAVGHTPNTEVFAGQLELDETGYIVTRPGSTATSVEGVFAAGDVQDRVYRQAVTAAGTGCMAALEAQRYLETL